MKTIKSLREELEKAQIAELKKIKKEWDGNLNSFEEAKKLLAKFEDIEIYLPWIKKPFQDIYEEDLKKKEWEEFVLSGVCGKGLQQSYLKQGYDKYNLIADDCLNEYADRNSIIYLIDMIKGNLDCEEYESENEMIPVLTSRTTSNHMGGKDRVDGLLYQIEIPILQYITDIIKWCLKNKCTGYTFDW